MASWKTSAVWQFFDLSENGSDVVCRWCQIKLAYNNSARAMRDHLKHRHVDVNLEQAAAGAGASQTPQTPITSFTAPTHRRCDPARSEKITQLITAMAAEDMLPLNFVETKGFQKIY